ncbi:MAG: TOMM precursor leader peptide-binding protein [Propionibacteriaceae bacterium]|nr:TOMM precursor leader peptide-binding protein [Propionibacteriaceae bacterium]
MNLPGSGVASSETSALSSNPEPFLRCLHPRLRADLEVIQEPNGRCLFVGPGRFFHLSDPSVGLVLPLLTGELAPSQICATLRPRVGFFDVIRILRTLEALDTLRDGPPPSDLATARLLDAWPGGRPIPGVVAAINVVSEPIAAQVEDLLHGFGVTLEWLDIEAVEGRGDPLLVLVNDYLDPILSRLNRRCLDNARQWLPLKPAAAELWVGPLFEPPEAPCWECLAHRLSGHRAIDRYARLTVGRTVPLGSAEAGLPATWGIALGLALTALAKGSLPELLTLDLTVNDLKRHVVTRRPQCPACGRPDAWPRPINLVRRPKALVSPGHYARRWRSADATRAATAPHIDALTGIVTSVVPVDTGTDLFFNFTAGHDFAVAPGRLDNLIRTVRGGHSGSSSRTREAAETGAICEALERGLTVFRGDEPRIRASQTELGDQALDFAALLGYSEEQYRHRAEHEGEDKNQFEYVPHRFDASLVTDWSAVQSVRTGQLKYVPSAHCYYGHPALYEHSYCIADSNGTAAGSCLEEAIVRGFCELVERDSAALWWYNRLRRPALDLESVGDRYIERVIDFHTQFGRRVWGLDLTADMRVPCFAMMSARIEADPEDIIVAFGCDLDPLAALASAVDEMNQFWVFVKPDLNGKAQYWGANKEAVEWFRTATLETEEYLLPDPALPAIRPTEKASLATDDHADDVMVCAETAAAIGSELYVLDLSRPEVDLAVVRTIAPGLRHFWRRLAPGRLYDVPVKLGWLSEPLPEANLNPRTVFF